MTPNINPNDHSEWDRRFKNHMHRRKKQERAAAFRKISLGALGMALIAACLFLNIRDRRTNPPAISIDDSIRKVLDDTLQINAHGIPGYNSTRSKKEDGL